MGTVVNQRIPRPDWRVKVTGQASYTSDMALPRMLHAAILRSPVPHARVLSIDISRAAKLHGVRAIICGKDTLGRNFGILGTSEKLMDRHALVTQKVRYIGDEVAAVAAVDLDTALEALSLIEVEYESLPAVFDPIEAMKEGAPLIHEDKPGNISKRHVVKAGDPEAGFKEAFVIREDRFTTHAEAHVPMEPHVTLASYDAAGKLTVWSSTQGAFLVQLDLARTLGLPEGRVRVIKPHVGGGFGAKSDGMDSLDFCASLLSRKTGCPVKIAYTREEELIYTRRRHPLIIDLKTGVRKDGTISARSCRAILDGGAYNSWGPLTTILCANWNLMPYRLANYQYEGLRPHTNKAPGGAMRGHGAPQIHFAVESQLDMLARELGMDPIEIRLRNALEAGDLNPSGFFIPSSGFKDCLEEASRRAGWKDKWGKLPPGKGIGVGCSGFVCGAAFPVRPTVAAFSSSRIVVSAEGHVTLYTGAVDTGQGSDFTLAQITAEEMGVPVEEVSVVAADTDLTPMDSGNYSSRTTMLAGNATKSAAAAVKEQVLDSAADLLEAKAVDLEAQGGRIYVKGSPVRSVSFLDAVKLAYGKQGGKQVSAERAYVPPKDKISPSISFSVQIAEVEVDRETGHVQVTDLTSAHDCGVPINPLSVEGQLQGSVYMGVGFALSEGFHHVDGQSIETSFADYRMPTVGEMPRVAAMHVEVMDPEGPFGAKEAGEGTVGPTAPAIANAIFDASGIRLKDLPFTPEKVLEALDKRAPQGS
ncbi:MAG: molybdopterin-dependent oxidoreductase [Dehalococcoidia bacterium]|nr:molybdopterin-dependent oxidoreductase [Dehalococcoidia bacterium]